MNIYEEYLKLDIESNWIGLEKGEETSDYSCTPLGAHVIGWEECDGIHYCFIDGFDEKVFAVNPSSCAEKDGVLIYAYPLAENFEDFLRLILAGKGVTAIEQIVWFTKKQYNDFVISDDNNNFCEEVNAVLNEISKKLNLKPMENPYEYVRKIQDEFDYSKLRFSDEFYDETGLEKPED